MSNNRPAAVGDLVERATQTLRDYLTEQESSLKTARLKDLAEIVVALRGSFELDDGRHDWSGRSTGYRSAMAEVYDKAALPADERDTVQAALRYHVGNLLRENTSPEELASVGLTSQSPKERLAGHRQALAAQREMLAPRQDAARLAAYAQALLEFVDEESLPALPPERAVATRLGLEAVQGRSAQLLVRLADAVGGRQQSTGGRHRRRSADIRGL